VQTRQENYEVPLQNSHPPAHRPVPIAKSPDATTAQFERAWRLKNPTVSTVITGASRFEQVIENVKALGVAEKLTQPAIGQIESILQNRPEPEETWR